MRLLNRFEKKFDFFPNVMNVYACTGCGRCAIICPIKRSFPQLGAKLAERARHRAARAEVKK